MRAAFLVPRTAARTIFWATGQRGKYKQNDYTEKSSQAHDKPEANETRGFRNKVI
jgi:hypothetical protein